jgi:hypothetical protein
MWLSCVIKHCLHCIKFLIWKFRGFDVCPEPFPQCCLMLDSFTQKTVRMSFVWLLLPNAWEFKKKMRLACKSRVCKIPARGFQESLYITTLFTAYKRPSLFYVSQHLGRKAHECVIRPSPLYGKGNKTRWQVVFGVLFLGKLCSNIPTVQVCHEVEGRAGGRG